MAQIFESPDGGETVYVRESGSTERHLHRQSPKAISKWEELKSNQLWYDIRQAAKTNPTLQKALDECIVIYHLSKK